MWFEFRNEAPQIDIRLYINVLTEELPIKFACEIIGSKKIWHVYIENLEELRAAAFILENKFRASINFNVSCITVSDFCERTLDYMNELKLGL